VLDAELAEWIKCCYLLVQGEVEYRPDVAQMENAYRKVLVFSRLIKFMSICKVIVY